MNKLIYIAFFILLGYAPLHSQTVTILGNAPEYAGMEIRFYTYADLITKTEQKLVGTYIDKNGNFSCSFTTNTTKEIYTLLGIYKACMYAEPGKKYDVVLPPRIDKTIEDELNPIFTEELISIGIKSTDVNELNHLIYEFNQHYETFVNKHFNWLYIFSQYKMVDSITHIIDSLMPYRGNAYFNAYRTYKYASLYHFVYERDKYFVTRKYLLNKPFHLSNVAYMEFINTVWNDYFTAISTESEILYQAIVYGKSPKMVKDFFEQKIALRNDTLKELLLLHGLHQTLSFPDNFPPQTINQTLDSIIITSKIPEHKIIAQNIKNKYTITRAGDMAPDFKMITSKRDSLGLKSFAGKYIYLNFCRSENFACQKDYRLIQNIQNEFKDDLEIVTLSYDKDFQTFTDFINQNPLYNWHFLYANQNKELLERYNVKAMPTYILIDPTGKLLLFPAPSLHENFIQIFTQILHWRKRVKDLENPQEKGHFERTIPE